MARIRVRATINKLSARGRACARILPPRAASSFFPNEISFLPRKSRHLIENCHSLWTYSPGYWSIESSIVCTFVRRNSRGAVPLEGWDHAKRKGNWITQDIRKKRIVASLFFLSPLFTYTFRTIRNFYVRGLSYYRLKSTNITSVNMLERMRWQWN